MKGLGIDKWEHYLSIYEAEFAPKLRLGHPVSLLEVGVQNGGSLELWSKYLPAGSTIVGIDIDTRVASLKPGTNVEIHVSDINDQARVLRILDGRTFNVIIDDASHKSSDTIAAFRTLFPILKPNGIFLIEDLHASYWPALEGGFRAPHTSLEFFKGLVDALHIDHFRPSAHLEANLSEELVEVGMWINRLTFYDSITVVQKRQGRKTGPYRRILNGSVWDVVDPLQEFLTHPVELVGNVHLGRPVAELLQSAEEKRAQASQEKTLCLLRAEVEAKQKEIERLACELGAVRSMATDPIARPKSENA